MPDSISFLFKLPVFKFMLYSNEVMVIKKSILSFPSFNLISLSTPVCVCPLLASCSSHSCLLIPSKLGHDTAESGRANVIVSLMETLVTHFPLPSPSVILWLFLIRYC